MDEPKDDSKAAGRYYLLQATRLAGIFMTMFGALIVADRMSAPEPLGPILFVGGPLLFFAVPVLLARHWKRQKS